MHPMRIGLEKKIQSKDTFVKIKAFFIYCVLTAQSFLYDRQLIN